MGTQDAQSMRAEKLKKTSKTLADKSLRYFMLSPTVSETTPENILRYIHANKTGALIRGSVETGALLAGGFGSAVAEYLEDANKQAHLLRLGIGDKFVPHGKSALMYEQLGLSEQTIAKQILQWKIK